MTDNYEKSVQLATQFCKAEDYAHRGKVRTHNEAMDKLSQLEAEMIKADCTGDLTMLLRHDDERVRLSAAAMCLRHGLMDGVAEQALTELTKCSDKTIGFAAEMVLKNKEEP